MHVWGINFSQAHAHGLAVYQYVHRVAIEDGHHDTGEVGVCGTYKKPQRDDSEKFRRFHASHEKSLVVVKTPVHE
ncbi:MAG: hypothetical protein KBF41_13185 [Azonexus sp.]|nr:hypothetical protein [Azonexus sp.]